jgi:small subunit ribosomal protein S18
MKRQKQCYFCSQNAKVINSKEVLVLKKFISSQEKIINPKHTNVCTKHQRLLAKAIKRARAMGLLPFVRK